MRSGGLGLYSRGGRLAILSLRYFRLRDFEMQSESESDFRDVFSEFGEIGLAGSKLG